MQVPIEYKHSFLARQFDQAHPALRGMVLALAMEAYRRGLPVLTITQIDRSEAQMAAIYGEDWKKRGKFSWHLKRKGQRTRAADLRVRDWPIPARNSMYLWAKDAWPHAEIILHDVGVGIHLHVAAPSGWSMMRRLKRWATLQAEKKAGRVVQ